MPTADAERQALAERVVRGMLDQDAFSKWLGIDVLEIAPRRSTVRMTVRPEMVNGFGVAHGGIAYSLADSALAFASNTHGQVTVAVDNSIAYPTSVHAGDVITAVATEESSTNRLAFYRISVTNQQGAVVAVCTGTVYNTRRDHGSGAGARKPGAESREPTTDG